MNFKQIVEREGVLYEEHDVVTDDGYILTMQRIRAKGLPKVALVVLLQHGLLSQSDTWIDNDPSVAVAFRLVREGYDVFLGNNRGNSYSLRHQTLNYQTQPAKFFDYSFQTLG